MLFKDDLKWVPVKTEIARQCQHLALITDPIILSIKERYRCSDITLGQIFNQPETIATRNLLALRFLINENRRFPLVTISGTDSGNHLLEYFVIVDGGIAGEWRNDLSHMLSIELIPKRFVHDSNKFEPSSIQASFTREFLGMDQKSQDIWLVTDFDMTKKTCLGHRQIIELSTAII